LAPFFLRPAKKQRKQKDTLKQRKQKDTLKEKHKEKQRKQKDTLKRNRKTHSRRRSVLITELVGVGLLCHEKTILTPLNKNKQKDRLKDKKHVVR